MCPIVPTLTCGLVRSKVSLSHRSSLLLRIGDGAGVGGADAGTIPLCASDRLYAGPVDAVPVDPRAAAGTRTQDLFLTKEVLYQLSYSSDDPTASNTEPELGNNRLWQ